MSKDALPINKIRYCRKCAIQLTNDNWPRSWQITYNYKCSPCHTKYYRRLRKDHPDRRTNYEMLTRYGVTLEQYNSALKQQGFKCAICRRRANLFKKRLHIDHCHKTNKVRGLICYGCNHFLGQIKDDLAIIERARKYLSGKYAITS